MTHTPGPWTYLKQDPQSWAIGFYDSRGRFHVDSFCATREKAAQRVQYMNELAAIAKAEGRTA